jgi:hypothetical protein
MASTVLSWPANSPDDNVLTYKVYGALGTGVAFGSTALLATVAGLTWTHTGLGYNEAWAYYLVAHNRIGDGLPKGPLNITTVAAAGDTLLEASEAIAAPAAVNVFDASGAPKVRNANATAAGREASGFVTSSVAPGGSVYVSGAGKLSGLGGLTAGPVFLGTADGQITNTPPSAAGNVLQRLGTAVGATVALFQPGSAVELA